MIKNKFISGKPWFFEDIIPGEDPTFTWGFFPKKKIFSGKSKFQKFEIFETEKFGRVLVLDGLVQLSTKQEHVYHEMLSHPAFFYCKDPKRVLVIGGGDGGVAREVLKHPNVREVFLVDIDKMVTDVSKKYMPSLSRGVFSDKRLKILHQDAILFVRQYKNYFDVIIDDLTDPVGPSLFLWSSKFYSDIKNALKENGVAAFQTAYLQESFAKKSRNLLKKIFPHFAVHKAYVGCFPFDEHTFSFCSKTVAFDRLDLESLKEKFKKSKIKTRYYSPEIHFASKIFSEKK
jgi:spermidine synthase